MKHNNKWTIAITGILLLPFAILEFYYATLLSFEDTHSVTPFTVSNHSIKKVVYYYSPGRSDRSGAIIHDMLFAHAYTFHTNINQSNIYAIYGGCCGRNIKFRNETYHLLFDLHWDTILKFDCPPPPSSRNRTTAKATATDMLDDDNTYILLDPKVYRKSDVYSFTTEWRNYFMKQIYVRAQQQPPPQQISTTDANPVNTNNLPSNAIAPYRNNIEIVHDVVPIQYSIAVHIRRGDINPCNKYKGRYLPNSHYLQLIQQYISIFLLSSSSTTNTTQPPPISRENIAVTIYSESISYESLDIFEQYNCTVSVDDELSTVWSALSTAHVAILSKSSFSYVPAIMNPNRVVYTPFRHKPMDYWDIVSDPIISESMSEVMKLRRRTCPESSTT